MAPRHPKNDDGPTNQDREAIMKKLIFIAFVVITGLAVILDDGRPHPRRRRP